MGNWLRSIVLLRLTAAPAIAATAAAEAAQSERVGPLGIIIFVVLLVTLSVGMVAAPFLRRGGNDGDADKPPA